VTFGRRAHLAMIVATVAGLTVAAGAMTSPAGAHAQVKKSSPADGALLDEAPSEVVITFTEPPDPQLSTIDVVTSSGQSVTTGSAEIVPGDVHEVRVGVEDLPKGVYTITWRAVSKTDGHVTGGSLSFGVGVQPPKPGEAGEGATETSNPTPLSGAGRWGFYSGLIVLFAAWPMGAALERSGSPSKRLLAIALAVGAAGLAAMFLAESRAVGVSLGRLATSATGRELVYRGVGLAVSGVAVALYAMRPSRPALSFVTIAAAATMYLHAKSGHAGAAQSYTWLRIAIQWVHVMAVGMWVGGLVWLLSALRSLDDDARRRAVARFSFVAGVTLAIVVATGVAREVDEIGGLGNLGSLVHTNFGLTLLVKTGLVLVLIALGARNRYVNVPGFGKSPDRARSLGRTVTAEVVIAALVLAATGVLSQFPPPADLRAASATRPRELVVRGSDFATTLKAELTITPGTIGPNRFGLRIEDFDTGAAFPADRVALKFRLPDNPRVDSTLELEKASPGLWRAQGTQLAITGTWDVSAVIQGATGSTTVDLQVEPRRPPQDIAVSRQPGQPTIYTIQLGDGATVQTYVDPGKAGTNNVHYTFFAADGKEPSVEDATATGTSPEGNVETFELQKFSAGHFVANVDLDAGRWVFDIGGTSDAGPVAAYFSQTIAP
jgi:copper transport protein